MTQMNTSLLLRAAAAAAVLCLSVPAARADAVGTLQDFVGKVKSGKGSFTQSVTSPDGKKTRKSTGSLEFQRPNRFRFAYDAPVDQLIVGDGRQVWLYDKDLEQVTVRPMDQALGATPAALLSGGSLEKDFSLKALPADAGQGNGGIAWVEAVPRGREGQFQSVRIGFKGRQLAALEILDSFGQKSRLDFAGFEANVPVQAERFQFTPPAGVDVLKQ